ncbi:MAG TPA: hypothetical protein PK331_17800 [Gordonia sp. (in: high G+C Gram-positive bacteria)]|uniref:hypothetical protein n=1 Tax=unclassified Gordonia (in: high G+C Gram-positive bacteria) TaxID=2657482 RepID=UPI0025C02721|nr:MULTISPECIES: hypothetical protein [unclassified Gordonia (in: high G+C Gram-positive bacteria)]HNP56682.1 hypothetical protein [Gordonia sp. (in: high G+C Gram-positive bacteria)]HRC52760.1 hypothetical protein [Gordonia sp. (in: high G+C Gram-positive bacteria)]
MKRGISALVAAAGCALAISAVAAPTAIAATESNPQLAKGSIVICIPIPTPGSAVINWCPIT